MLLSLMICTYKRKKELKDVIKTLSPLPREVEIVLVDQNSVNERVSREELVETGLDSDQLTIVYRDLGSLSSARNEGFKRCKGDFIGFPDDDNYYEPSFRERIVAKLDSIRHDINCGGVILNWRAFRGFPKSDRKMKRSESLRYGNSGTLVVRRDIVCQELGMRPFPEDMSPGTRYPAGDETYFLACLLKESGLDMVAAPDIYIDHPVFPETNERERVYGYGLGALAYKLIVLGWGPGFIYAIKLLIGPLVKIFALPLKGRSSRIGWIMLHRRWKGAIDYYRSS